MKVKTLATFSIIPTILLGSLFGGFVAKNASEVNAATTFKYSSSDDPSIMDGYKLATLIYKAQSKTLDFSENEEKYLRSNFQLEYDGLSNKNYNVAKLDDCYWVEAFADKNYTPKFLVAGDKVFNFERLNKQFIARADTLYINDARIIYESSLLVSADDANKVLTSAYPIGKEEAQNIKLVNDYNTAFAERTSYEEKLAAYNNYQIEKSAYDLAKNEFDKYKIAKKTYDEQLAKYQKYINEDLPKYTEQLAKYNKYLEELAVYEKNKAIYGEVYEQYSQQMTIINSHLAILDILYNLYGDLQISAYDFINSDSVDVVIERRGEIVAAGVEGAAVDNCKEKTIIAKRLLKEYYGLRKAEKSEKYNWYKTKYISLRNALTSLTACLEYFYSLSIVRNFIQEKGKQQKYELFISELMYFCDMINSSPVDSYLLDYKLDQKRKLGGVAKTYPEILKTELMDTSINPMPLNSAFPVAPGEAVSIKPAEVEKPVDIVEVKKPIAPTVVADPGQAPVEIKKPAFVEIPTKPNIVLRPEYEPLAEDFNANLLINRTPISGDISIKINQEVEIEVSKVTDVLALFDTANGVTPGKAKFKEFIYFTDPSKATHITKLPSKFGYITSLEGAGEIIFANAESILTDMSSQSASAIIDKQAEALEKFNIKWIHVLDNENHTNYVELGYFKVNFGYELMLPSYGDPGTIPSQSNKYIGNQILKYNFVGYDYTETKDDTLSGLSGLETVADIVEAQGESDSITIYVVFKPVEVFEVSFNNGETKLIEKGTAINPFVGNPSKPDSDLYRFEFIGWSIDGNNVVTFPYEINANVDFKPVFEALRFYQIRFMVDGLIVNSQKVPEGSLPVVPTNISKERIGNSCFEFAGWSSQIEPACEDVTYIAKFNSFDFVEDADFSETNKELIIEASHGSDEIKVNKLFEAIKVDEIEVRPMKIKIDNADIVLNASQVSYLANIGTTSLSVSQEKLENEEIELRLIVKDKTGDEITNANVNALITLNDIDDPSHLRAFSDEDEIEVNVVDKSTISVITKGVNKLNLKYFYQVSFDKYMSALTFKINGEDVPAGASYEYERGTQIQISATPNPGVKVLGLFTLDKNGKRTNLDENPIEICDSNLSVFANIEREIYTVNIYVDEKIVQQIKATHGSLIALPNSVTKLPDDEFRYVFIGWDKEIEIIEESVDVHAKFEKIAIDDAEGGEEVKSNGLSFAQKLAIGALSLTIGGVALAVILVIVKTRKKPQK